MKLTHIIFGLIILTALCLQMHLPAYLPVLAFVALILLAPIFGLIYAAIKALWLTVKHFSDIEKSMKLPATLLSIKESITELKKRIYGDKSNTIILNSRNEEYIKLFASLSQVLKDNATEQYEIKSHFDFSNPDNIVHTIEAKTPLATWALTNLKNSMLANGVDVTFS